MAQRDHKKEEPTEVRAPEITLCANSCGFPGNPATQNLCQNCYLAAQESLSSSSMPAVSVSTPVAVVLDRPRPAAPEESSPTCAAVDPAPTPVKNRCSSCRKRVGLTGFRCRCDKTFCGEHRYSDRHGCTYDYKAAARDAIARDNPVVRAAKIVRF